MEYNQTYTQVLTKRWKKHLLSGLQRLDIYQEGASSDPHSKNCGCVKNLAFSTCKSTIIFHVKLRPPFFTPMEVGIFLGRFETTILGKWYSKWDLYYNSSENEVFGKYANQEFAIISGRGTDHPVLQMAEHRASELGLLKQGVFKAQKFAGKIESPKFTHECPACVYLGKYFYNSREYDLYYCSNEPTVIARWGNIPWEYTSGITNAEYEPPLLAAQRLAIARGLIDE